MGNAQKPPPFQVLDNPARTVFVTCKSRRLISDSMFSYMVFTFEIRYLRFKWEIRFRFDDILRMDRKLVANFPTEMMNLTRPSKHNKLFWTHDKAFLDLREQMMTKYLQEVMDIPDIITTHPQLRSFLGCCTVSFIPDLGRKGKEGWLKKSSGGYHSGFSRKTGDYITIWQWRWVVLQDTCITWFRSPEDGEPNGSLQIDSKYTIHRAGRVLTVSTMTRKVCFFASTTRLAEEWEADLRGFYSLSPRMQGVTIGGSIGKDIMLKSSYPPREKCQVKVYTTSRDYMSALALALLHAQKEIMITSWKSSPTVLLTRPPLPPLRLDHILKFKAEQGVKIYILLYKEVEHIGQGNDSFNTKKKLESLSSNIHVIRHPNKFLGGSTAVLWSHHEKFVIIDRNSLYIGGIDLAFQRYDDEQHRICDEDGLLYPGQDYRQPAPDLFKPARRLEHEDEALDEDLGEIEVAVEESTLPIALSALVDDDNQPMEVQVVVDFNDTSITEQQPQSAFSAPVTAAPNHGSDSDSGGAPMKLPRSAHEHHPPLTSPLGDAQYHPDHEYEDHNLIAAGGDVEEEEEEEEAGEQNLTEDRDHPLTTAELAAMNLATTVNNDNSNSSFTDRASIFAAHTRSSLTSSLSNLTEHFCHYTKRMEMSLAAYSAQLEASKRIKKSDFWQVRDTHPRMGWHDVATGITGSIARDASSHFIQRWNHHRLSTSSYDAPMLIDITDDLYFSCCARCQQDKILETLDTCPNCGYNLGPVNSYSQPEEASLIPPPPSRFSFLTFMCSYSITERLPFRMEGDCPVVVIKLPPQKALFHDHDNTTGAVEEEEGVLLEHCGTEAEWLTAFGLVPAEGDVILAINSVTVSHLNSHQLKRLIVRIKRGLSVVRGPDPEKILVTFRRHFVEGDAPRDKTMYTDNEVGTAIMNKEKSQLATIPEEEECEVAAAAASAAASPWSQESASAHSSSRYNQTVPPSSSSSSSAAAAVAVTVPAAAPVATLEPELLTVKQQSMNLETILAIPTSPVAAPSSPNNSAFTATAAVTTVTAAISRQQQSSSSGNGKAGVSGSNSGSSNSFPTICRAAAQLEIRLSLSQLFHNPNISRYCDSVPRLAALADQQGDCCKVQFLRSVGKWSVGTETERSIYGAYIEAIAAAQYFIYIENQFFVSNNHFIAKDASSHHQYRGGKAQQQQGDIENSISAAIAQRIELAFKYNQENPHFQRPFRVIIIIPLHPNGDFCSAMKAKVVMHYEYVTICRGLQSLFSRLRETCQGINLSDYIAFFSLKNWGVINNKVVTEQVYVHDKLMIVDDRVVIIGSANINDRSMLGHRDSEAAVRIEDSLEIEVLFNNRPVTVGYLPHVTRMKLMRQHVSSEDLEISDILSANTYQNWRGIGQRNSMIHDQLDGQLSLYRCKNISDYKHALENHVHKSIFDADTQEALQEIRGFLVDWPEHLFMHEDLSPSVATRAIIPNELWV